MMPRVFATHLDPDVNSFFKHSSCFSEQYHRLTINASSDPNALPVPDQLRAVCKHRPQ